LVRGEVSRRSYSDLVDFLLLGILSVFLFVSPWFYGLTRFRDRLVAEIFILGLSLIAFPLLTRDEFLKRSGRTFDLFIFWSLILTLFYVLFSALPYHSFLAFGQFFSGFLFYLLVRRAVRSPGRFYFFLGAIIVSGLFYSAYGLAQYYGFLPHRYWYDPSFPSSRYIYSGHFAVFLLFPLFLSLAAIISVRKWTFQLVLSLALGLMGWAFLLSRCRTAWAAFLIGAAIFVVLARKSRILTQQAARGLILFGIAVGLILFVQSGFEEAWGRIADLWAKKNQEFFSLIYRWELWQGAFQAIVARPWGWGFGTFSFVFPQYQVEGGRFFIHYAFNEFVQAGVDFGVPGLLFLLGFLFFYFRRAFLFLEREERIPRRAMGAGFLALGIALIIVCQTDCPLRIYSIGLLFAGFLALSAYLFSSDEGGGEFLQAKVLSGALSRGTFLIRSLCFGAVFLTGVLTVRQLFGEIHFERGRGLEKKFSWGKAAQEYQRAVHLSPFYGPYHEARGGLFHRWSAISMREDQKKPLREKARQSFEEAARLQPYSAGDHYYLALVYEEEGDWERAKAELKKAMNLDPTNSFFVSEYGYFALRHSLEEEAIRSFEKFKAMPFKEGTRGDVCEILRECYALTRDYQQLKRVIPDNWPGHYCFGTVLAEKGRWDLAKIEFDAGMRIAQAAFEPELYYEHVRQAVADVYLASNRVTEAAEVYEKALAKDPGDFDAQKRLEKLIQQFGRVAS